MKPRKPLKSATNPNKRTAQPAAPRPSASSRVPINEVIAKMQADDPGAAAMTVGIPSSIAARLAEMPPEAVKDLFAYIGQVVRQILEHATAKVGDGCAPNPADATCAVEHDTTDLNPPCATHPTPKPTSRHTSPV